MSSVNLTKLDHKTSTVFNVTPTVSRAPTPLWRQRLSISESARSQLRSRSRARPGRSVDDPRALIGGPTSEVASERYEGGHTRIASRVSEKSTGDGSEEFESDPKLDAAIHPRDELGEEMSEQARVWKIYIAETTKADISLTEDCNRSMDVLLVFTGLFSAVLTTFIIQSFQLMLPQSADTTNALLGQLILIQASMTATVAPPPPPTISGNSNGQLRWVNGLWFAALACSLSTALISMLAKQWLQAYLPNVSGSPRERSRRRQARYRQLEVWHVLAIINSLPLLLHVALLLFFAGLLVLLWSIDLGITLATWLIVALAYSFYIASIVLPLLYPDCPYQHPLSDHIQRWMQDRLRVDTRPAPPSKGSIKAQGIDVESASETESISEASVERLRHTSTRPPRLTPEALLDASALVWLFTKSNDASVVAAALQAIAGLPRSFTGIHILRDAGALRLIESGFESCFQQDTTVDLQWHLTNPDGAELYCRAWLRLTRDTAEKWPFELLEPLWILQDYKSHPAVAAMASCAVALSSFDSHVSQWELLVYLASYVAGEMQLSQTTQCWLLDTLVECLLRWEMPTAVIRETTLRGIPVLLRLLHLTEDSPASSVRGAVALSLYVLTGGKLDLEAYRDEESRKAGFCELTLSALSVIVQNPSKYGVKDALMDITAQQLAKLSSPVVARSERFPHTLRDVARASLAKLYVDGFIGVGVISDTCLADVLHLLFPLTHNELRQPELLVKALVSTMWATTHPETTSWSIRLLEVLMTQCEPAVCQAFVDNNGLKAILRAARAGGIDSQRLQIDSLRTLCAYINTLTILFLHHHQVASSPTHPESNAISAMSPIAAVLHAQFEPIFDSDFFDILLGVVAARKSWLFEVSGQWMPALTRLCGLQPWRGVWKKVTYVFYDFAERNVGEEGYAGTQSLLDVMNEVIELAQER